MSAYDKGGFLPKPEPYYYSETHGFPPFARTSVAAMNVHYARTGEGTPISGDHRLTHQSKAVSPWNCTQSHPASV